jgi:tRNA-intron endonuclease
MDEKPNIADVSEIKAKGILTKKGVEIAEKSSIDSLSQRGYGTAENEVFTLSFYEALYLHDKDLLEVKDKDGEKIDFQRLLRCYETVDENAWVNYLVYRDLRSRGYVVREGFGAGIDFRIYERGAYGKDTAQYLVLSVQEGRPLPIQTLVNAVQQCQSQKKELILAVMNRRGEAVHYSVAPLTFK